MVAAQLYDTNPSKAPALKYNTQFEAANGPGSVSPFGGYLVDSGAIIETAAAVVLKSGSEPETPAFRSALRDAIETLNGMPGVHGTYTGSPTLHDLSSSDASRVMAVVDKGTWTIAK